MKRAWKAVLRYFGWYWTDDGPATEETDALPPGPASVWNWPTWPVTREHGDRKPQGAHVVRGRWIEDNERSSG